jgi:exosortase A
MEAGCQVGSQRVDGQVAAAGWRRAGTAVSALLLLVLLLYRDTVLYLAHIWAQWRTGAYGHGYLVLAISLYLVYRQRRVLAGLTPCPSIAALPAIAAAALLWLAATLVDVLTLQSVALLLLTLAVIWAMLGLRVTRHLFLPVLFIGFALPVWSPLAHVLQDVTADVVFWLARLSDVPVIREEYTLVLPSGQLTIEEACAGLRYLLAAVTLGVLYGYVTYGGPRARVLVVLVAAGAAIVANILRVFIVVYVAYATQMQSSLVSEHQSLGWMLFGGLVMLLLVLDLRLSRSAATAGTAAAVSESGTTCRDSPARRALLFVASLLLIVCAPVLAWWSQQPVSVAGEASPVFPPALQGWSGPSETGDSWMPRYHGAVAALRTYHRDADVVYLYVGYYARQSQGRELINELNRIADPGVWSTSYPAARPVSVDSRPVLEQVIISPAGRPRLVWYWYQVGGRQTINRYIAKALQVLGLVTGRTQASVTAVAVDIVTGEDGARRLLRDFVAVMGPSIAQMTDPSPDFSPGGGSTL